MSAPEKIYMSEHTASREGFKKKYAKDDLEYIRSDLYEQDLTDCKKLANGIADVAKAVGIYNGEVNLTGPELLLLCENIKEQCKRHEEAVDRLVMVLRGLHEPDWPCDWKAYAYKEASNGQVG